MSPNDFDTPNNSHTKKVGSANDQHSKMQKRQLVLSIETTGFSPRTDDRIVEIGIVEIIDQQLTSNTFHVYLNPERTVGGSEFIHKLSDIFLSTKPLFVDIADELEAFLIGAEVIAHNVQFKMRFLDAEWHRAGRIARSGSIRAVDTIAITKSKFSRQLWSIDDLVKRFNILKTERTFHGALLDAEILAEIYLKLTDETTEERFEITEPDQDPVYEEVMEYVIKIQKVDVSSIQRKFSLDYSRSARIVDALEENKVISPIGASGKYYVLIKRQP